MASLGQNSQEGRFFLLPLAADLLNVIALIQDLIRYVNNIVPPATSSTTTAAPAADVSAPAAFGAALPSVPFAVQLAGASDGDAIESRRFFIETIQNLIKFDFDF